MNQSDADLRPVLARQPLRAYLSEIWERRAFLRTVPRNNLRAAHLDTVLGNIWHFVNPALSSLVYILIFGLLLNTDRGVDNYPAFVVVGVLTFNLLTQTAVNATRVMYANLHLIRSIYFPRAIVPITSALTNLATFGPALLVMLGTVVVSGELPTWRWLLLPVVITIVFVMTMGVALVGGRAGYELPDLYSLLPHLLRLLFYGSGILFLPAAFTDDERLLLLFEINPAFEVVSLMRWCLTGQPVDAWIWAAALTWALFFLIGGLVYFWRAEISYGGVQ